MPQLSQIPAPWGSPSPQLTQYLLIVHLTFSWPRSALRPSSSATEPQYPRPPLYERRLVRHSGPFASAAGSLVDTPDPTALVAKKSLDDLITFGPSAPLDVPHPWPVELLIEPCGLVSAVSHSHGIGVNAIGFPESTSRSLKSTVRSMQDSTPIRLASRPARRRNKPSGLRDRIVE